MDQLPPLGTSITGIMSPTFQIYSRILPNNANAIHSTPKQTHQYGPLDRHTLDIYHPSTSPNSASSPPPVLIYLHGGGLVSGSRILENDQIPDGLAYANVGHFFAKNYGYTVIIPNYRLMKHGARFPSGGEDVALVVEWLLKNSKELGGDGGDRQTRDLFVLGHSAGGVHLTTYLFGSIFQERRKEVLGHAASLRLKGVLLLCVPLHMRYMPEEAMGMVRAYWGDRAEEDAPLGLLKTLVGEHGSASEALPGVKFLVLKGQYDAEDEVIRPLEEFEEVWRDSGCDGRDLQIETLAGHNHVSPVLSVGTGIPAEEAWGHMAGVFVNTVRALA